MAAALKRQSIRRNSRQSVTNNGNSDPVYRRQLTPEDFYGPLVANSTLASAEITLLIDEVLQYPDLYPGSALLQQGVYVVFVLAIEDRNRVALGEAGACQSVIKVMELWPKHKKIQVYGCAAIANLSYINRFNQDALGGFGACEMVVRSMKMFPKCAELQVHGCTAVRNLAFEHHHNAVALGYCGARVSVNVAKINFPNDVGAPGLSHWAKEALKVLPDRHVSAFSDVVSEALTAELHVHKEENEEEVREEERQDNNDKGKKDISQSEEKVKDSRIIDHGDSDSKLSSDNLKEASIGGGVNGDDIASSHSGVVIGDPNLQASDEQSSVDKASNAIFLDKELNQSKGEKTDKQAGIGNGESKTQDHQQMISENVLAGNEQRK